MGMMGEFKDFIAKGNVMDLAVGVIIGGAFGKIVDSMVNDLIMPVVGKIIGGVDFSNLFSVLKEPAKALDGPMTLEALKKAGGSAFAYGNFFSILVNFIILAFIIFMLVKAVNNMKKPAAAAPPPPTPEDVVLLREIRDALKK